VILFHNHNHVAECGLARGDWRLRAESAATASKLEHCECDEEAEELTGVCLFER
jgi:hypothetical protein